MLKEWLVKTIQYVHHTFLNLNLCVFISLINKVLDQVLNTERRTLLLELVVSSS
jgi:hypothetical protein